MKDSKKDILFTVLLIVTTAVLFFMLGVGAAAKYGPNLNGIVTVELPPEELSTTTTTSAFKIDLNTATAEDLMRIEGIGEKTAQNILDYRNVLGRFKFVEQLLDVDGIGETKLAAWMPYLTVDGVSTTTTTVQVHSKIDLNTATVNELMTVDGIGEKTAQKIIDHRSKIGQFTSIEQLLDVDGIGDKKLAAWREHLIVNSSAPAPSAPQVAQKINLNTATKEELMTISGIGEKTAQKILDYRDKIGQFTHLDQLLKIDGIGENKLESWREHLTL